MEQSIGDTVNVEFGEPRLADNVIRGHMKRLLPLIALVFVTVSANQQTVKISPGFFNGKDFLDMSDTEKRAYVTGEINGMLVSPFFGAPATPAPLFPAASF